MTLTEFIKKRNDETVKLSPLVSVQDTENEVVLQVEMPGIQKEQISVEVQGDDLVISAKRMNETPKNYTALLQERVNAEYKRIFNISNEIDKSKISAQYENGVLSLRLQRSESVQPRTISIS